MPSNPSSPQLRAGAEKCETMQDVRRNIDRVDRALVELLAERISYIEQAGHIKGDRSAVRDPERIEDVITKVLNAGDGHDLPNGYLEDVFRHLVEWSIAHEFLVFDDLQ